ncbi:MAG TPA: aspartate aminotransferase family protein [Methylomirabilota bacterium]|jgi:glutamate-1-semialdehyde 2,1-aminomutase
MSTRFDDPGSHSRALYERARQVIPGGTSKANLHVRPHPFYLAEGRGCRVTDVDGVERLDAINNFTALIHGHAFPPLVDAVSRQLARGTAFSASTPEEVALAELLCERVPGLERIRFGNSGTEAVMMAIKAARAYTGRDRIAKFEGAYHGYYDDVQVSFSSRPDEWGPEDAPASVPSSGGVPKHRVLETLILPWNDPDACERLVTRHAGELAAVLVDPLANRMGFIPPAEGFLAFLRQLTRQHGVLLVFDEIISFRVGYRGAQGRYGGDPDLTAFGKIIGGGFPVGATGGRAEVMEVFDPGTRGARIASGGTFSANPVSMTGGLATMRAMTPAEFDRLEALGDRLRARLGEVFRAAGVPGQVTGAGSLFRLLFTDRPLRSYRDVDQAVEARVERLFRALLDEGVLLHTTGLGCLSTPMSEREVEEIAVATERALAVVRRG